MCLCCCCHAHRVGKGVPGMQVVFNDHNYTYSTSNASVLSTWPVSAPKVSVPPSLNSSHPVDALVQVFNIITLRSKLNWIGESSTLLGIASGETFELSCEASLAAIDRQWHCVTQAASCLRRLRIIL